MTRDLNVRLRNVARTALVVLAAFLPVACGGGEEPAQKEGTQAAALEALPDTAMGATFDSLEHTPDTVIVLVAEGQLRVPSILPPGQTVLEVRNVGESPQAFRIERAEVIDRTVDPPLQPGERRSVSLDLEFGEYQVSSPIPGEEGPFERQNVTVPPAATLDDSVGTGEAVGEPG